MDQISIDDTGIERVYKALMAQGFDRVTAVFIAYGARHAVDNDDFITQYGEFGNEVLNDYFFPKG
jgi:hypothetical protein